MKSKISNPLVCYFPCLMRRILDNKIVLVADKLDDDQLFRATIVSGPEGIGTSYTTDLKLEDYEFLPKGFKVTLTN